MTSKADGPGAGPVTVGTGRTETREERADRQWNELLQEVRVAQTGVQVLFAFLLAVAFQARFGDLSSADRTIYVVTVVLAAATAATLIGPVSYHRLLSGRQLKPQTVIWGSRVIMLGLLLLLCTMCAGLLLVLRVTLNDSSLAFWLVAGMAVWFVLCWFVFPVLALMRGARAG